MKKLSLLLLLSFCIINLKASNQEKIKLVLTETFTALKNLDKGGSKNIQNLFLSEDDVNVIVQDSGYYNHPKTSEELIRRTIKEMTSKNLAELEEVKKEALEKHKVKWKKIKFVGFFYKEPVKDKVYDGLIMFEYKGKRYGIETAILMVEDKFKLAYLQDLYQTDKDYSRNAKLMFISEL